MEDGETAAQAAVRELREETGYCGTVGRVSTVCYSESGMTGELNSTRVPMFPMIRLHAHPGIFVHEGAPVLHPNPAHTIFTSSVPRHLFKGGTEGGITLQNVCKRPTVSVLICSKRRHANNCDPVASRKQ